MNLVTQNSNGLVWFQTNDEIIIENGNYYAGGINTGIFAEGNSIVLNANPCTFQAFFAQTYTYVDGVWAIGNQEFYDAAYEGLSRQAGDQIKVKRDELLYASDWTQIPNNPLTTQAQEAWATYRQELRDVTAQSGYPFNVTFPIAPKLPSAAQPESSGLQQL
jgi:hypothetical protein